MKFRTNALAVALLCGVTAALTPAPADAQRRSAQQERQARTAEIPLCTQPLGAIAVLEPESTNWWTGQQLQSPAALIKMYVQRSRCFTLVDRGRGMAALQDERDLAAGGDLRRGSNVGRGQVRAADYVLVPDLVAHNANAGGNAIGAAIGGLLGSRNANLGRLAGGIDLRRKTADVMLTVTDMRSSEQVAMTEGHATKTDLGWGGSGSFWGGSGWGAAGASGYSNTEIGQVLALAYLQAYTDLVAQLGGLPADASAANAQQALTVVKPGRLLKQADGRGGAVRDLDPGMMLYPTGAKAGAMWEVEDELGNSGWVNANLLELSR